jgi:hypothetical protein
MEFLVICMLFSVVVCAFQRSAGAARSGRVPDAASWDVGSLERRTDWLVLGGRGGNSVREEIVTGQGAGAGGEDGNQDAESEGASELVRDG